MDHQKKSVPFPNFGKKDIAHSYLKGSTIPGHDPFWHQIEVILAGNKTAVSSLLKKKYFGNALKGPDFPYKSQKVKQEQ